MNIVPVNSRGFWLWCTDALFVGVNGFISGLFPGSLVGGVAAAQTDVLDPQQISFNAALGLLIAAVANGIKHVVVWHSTNPVPNPFRAPAGEPK